MADLRSIGPLKSQGSRARYINHTAWESGFLQSIVERIRSSLLLTGQGAGNPSLPLHVTVVWSSSSDQGDPMAKKSNSNKKPGRRPVKDTNLVPKGYEKFLGELKERIRSAQLKAAVSVNRELVLLYWQIGRDILARQKEHGWGAKVIDRLAGDLRREFPGMEGFSPRNLKYMRAFAQAWPDEPIVQEALHKSPGTTT